MEAGLGAFKEFSVSSFQFSGERRMTIASRGFWLAGLEGMGPADSTGGGTATWAKGKPPEWGTTNRGEGKPLEGGTTNLGDFLLRFAAGP